MEEIKKCKYCGNLILKGRSDKVFCSKSHYNRYYNSELKEMYAPLTQQMNATKRSYLALRRLHKLYGAGKDIPLTEAIHHGLDGNALCVLTRLNGVDGEFNKIGDHAYKVDESVKYIKIYQIKNGSSS